MKYPRTGFKEGDTLTWSRMIGRGGSRASVDVEATYVSESDVSVTVRRENYRDTVSKFNLATKKEYLILKEEVKEVGSKIEMPSKEALMTLVEGAKNDSDACGKVANAFSAAPNTAKKWLRHYNIVTPKMKVLPVQKEQLTLFDEVIDEAIGTPSLEDDIEIVQRYRCKKCGDTHNTLEAAKDCSSSHLSILWEKTEMQYTSGNDRPRGIEVQFTDGSRSLYVYSHGTNKATTNAEAIDMEVLRENAKRLRDLSGIEEVKKALASFGGGADKVTEVKPDYVEALNRAFLNRIKQIESVY